MKTVKQVVAILVWCAVSVGCVAEEAKQPVVAETPAVPVESAIQEKSKSGNDEITITTHVNPETGEEYQELNAKFMIKTINSFSVGHRKFFGINNISIITGRNTHGAVNEVKLAEGIIKYPDELTLTTPDKTNWNILKGMKASLYCKIEKPLNYEGDFCNPPRRYCSEYGDKVFLFNYHCSLIGKKDYFLNFDHK